MVEITNNFAYHDFYSLSISANNRRKGSGVKSVHECRIIIKKFVHGRQ